MMKLKHKLLIALAAFVIVVPLTILLGINLYIQSPRFQDTLENSLAERWGIRLKLQEATFTPWGGLNALGVCEAQTAATGKKTRLHAGLNIMALLQRQIVLHNVELRQPYAEWQVTNGNTGNEQAALSPARNGLPLQPAVRMASVSPTLTTATAKAASADETAEQDFQVTILDLKVVDGLLVIREGVQPPLMTLEGVNVSVSSLAPGEFHGDILVDKAQMLGSLALTQVRSPLNYRENELDFPKITASLSGGEVHGALTLKDLEARPHFDLQLDYFEVQLGKLINGWEKQLTFEKGKVEGGVRLSGWLDDVEHAIGTGEVIIAGARMGDDTFLSSIGQVFGIEELRNLYARQIVVSARMNEGILHLQQARLESESIICHATGELKGAGEIDFQVQLMLHEDLHSKIPPSFLQGFRSMEDGTFSCLDFVVLGNLDSPRTDLLDRLFPNKDIPVGNLLKLLFPQQNWYVGSGEDGTNS